MRAALGDEGLSHMSEIDEILKQVPMDQVAAALGVDQSQAEQATRTAIPALLGGMQANAADPAGAASLTSAVAEHDTSALGADLDQIDTHDGQRIVQNVFGDQTPDVMARLGGATPGAGSGLIQRLLPILAPIVMAYLAKKLQGAGAGSTSASATDDPMGGLGGLGGLGGMLGGSGGAGAGGLGDVLGSVLGGGAAGAGAGAGAQGGGIGDILGQVLGGAGGSQTQPGTPTGQGGMGDLLGGVLGGLLGGGKR